MNEILSLRRQSLADVWQEHMQAEFVHKDADRALDFYARAFGFAKKEAMPGPDGKTMHAEMTYKDAVVMFGPEGTFGGFRRP